MSLRHSNFFCVLLQTVQIHGNMKSICFILKISKMLLMVTWPLHLPSNSWWARTNQMHMQFSWSNSTLFFMRVMQVSLWFPFFFLFLWGPAYSVEHDGKESYVRATGSQYDLIATYEFKVLSMASYVVWKQTFATTNTTNDVSFRVDEGDWYVWRLPYKGSSSLWTQFYTQVLI